MSQSWNSRSRSDRFKTIVKKRRGVRAQRCDRETCRKCQTGGQDSETLKVTSLKSMQDSESCERKSQSFPKVTGDRVAGQHHPTPLLPRPQSRNGAPGGGSEWRTRVRGVMPGAPGHPQRGLTCAAERPGGIREASEAANCPGGHHLEQKRTKWKGLQVQMARQKTSPRRPVSGRCPTHCLTKTPMLSCHRPLNPALRSRLTGRKGLFLRWKEGGPSRRGHSAGISSQAPGGQPRDPRNPRKCGPT